MYRFPLRPSVCPPIPRLSVCLCVQVIQFNALFYHMVRGISMKLCKYIFRIGSERSSSTFVPVDKYLQELLPFEICWGGRGKVLLVVSAILCEYLYCQRKLSNYLLFESNKVYSVFISLLSFSRSDM